MSTILADIIDIVGIAGIIVAAAIGIVLAWPQFKKGREKGKSFRNDLKAESSGSATSRDESDA